MTAIAASTLASKAKATAKATGKRKPSTRSTRKAVASVSVTMPPSPLAPLPPTMTTPAAVPEAETVVVIPLPPKKSKRLPLPPWPAKNTERGPAGRFICRCGCGVEVAPPRRSWATPECLERVRLRCDWSVVRKHVYELGRGLCAACGCHPESQRAAAREALLEGDRSILDAARAAGWPRLGRVWYEIDHVHAVVDGGAQHGRKNLRLLCFRCHVARTVEQNRARRRKVASRQ